MLFTAHTGSYKQKYGDFRQYGAPNIPLISETPPNMSNFGLDDPTLGHPQNEGV